MPITPYELKVAIKKLQNNRACGPDSIPAEVLKAVADVYSTPLASLLNNGFAKGQPISLGDGTLICLLKPNKPQGVCSSLRPIVLLNCVRKAVSLMVLKRIRPKLDRAIGPYQSGFRAGRSTADAIWSHKWLVARIRKYEEQFFILGVDLSRAFDTIDRAKLLTLLAAILDDDEVRMVRMLLTETTLQLRMGANKQAPFYTNIGTPQGDALSPVLFVIYLDAALRDLALALETPGDLLQRTIAYADDADFICKDAKAVLDIKSKAPAVFATWCLQMNEAKTEETKVYRTTHHNAAVGINSTAWHQTKKLGSLLDDDADLRARKSIATMAFANMWKLWFRRNILSETNRVRLYKCYVLPVLLYNSGTWALTPTKIASLEAFHRRQLRQVLGIFYPHRIDETELMTRCASEPLGLIIARQRWRLFGHTLRLPPEVPANSAMNAYFEVSTQPKFRGRTKITLPIILHRDLQRIAPPIALTSYDDAQVLRRLAQDRGVWKELTAKIVASLDREYRRKRAKITFDIGANETNKTPPRRLRNNMGQGRTC